MRLPRYRGRRDRTARGRQVDRARLPWGHVAVVPAVAAVPVGDGPGVHGLASGHGGGVGRVAGFWPRSGLFAEGEQFLHCVGAGCA